MKSNASLIYGLLLVIGDSLALLAAFVAAYLLRGHFSNVPVAHPISAATYVGIFMVLLPFWILIFALLGLYGSNVQEKRFVELGRLLLGTFIGLLFVTSYAYMSNRTVFPSKLVPIYGFTLAFIFLALFRTIARGVRNWLFSYNIGITNLMIVGNTKITIELIKLLANSKISGYKIVGVVADSAHAKERFPNLSIFDTFDEAIASLKGKSIHGIVQTELYASSEKNNAVLEYSQRNHIAYRFVPGNSELFVGNIAVELFRGSIPVIAVHQTALIGWGRVVKRFIDLIVGGLFFLIALPFMIVIGLLIKISDPRAPMFFKDLRLTRFGTTVKIYKFRSHKRHLTDMTPEQAFAKMGKPELAEQYRKGGDQLPEDPRVSRIGKFLRKTSLDELPQLLNIVKGDISLVGPRPLQVSEWDVHKYENKDLILAIKSGLTGLAQVSGRKDLPPAERRKLDLFYVQNWSLWLDIIIIIKTFRVVLSRIGGGKVD